MNNNLFIEKYTPKLLNNFYLPNDIYNSINVLIKTDCLNTIFVGGMGTGKTSILHSIVKEYYHGNEEKNYMQNVLYINNLHEQGINYYRSEVKTFCQTHTFIKGKKKIIMIDDIDEINEQSQQVFRNCIDKYSHNVCFLATCTNGQKVIESIQSRLIIIKLPNIEPTIMYHILENIVKMENISIDNEAKDFIVSISNNTIKILINYLEKCKLLNRKITYDNALSICSDIDIHTLEKYTECIKSGNLNEAINIMYKIVNEGYSVMDILDNYFIFIKTTNKLIETDKYKIIPFICKYITAFHEIHENDIELPLFTNNIMKILSSH